MKELIAFYNVENLFSPELPAQHPTDPTVSGLSNWTSKRYEFKLHRISTVFNMIAQKYEALPMLIGLAEIQGKKPLQDLLNLSPLKENYQIVHFPSQDKRRVDVALLFDATKLELISARPIQIVFNTENTETQSVEATRDILHCKLKYGATAMHVFVLHLPSKRDRDVHLFKRKAIVKKLHEQIEILATEQNVSFLVLGDFNDNPDAEYLSQLRFSDTGTELLKNPFSDLYENEVFSTYHKKEGLLFDQILLSSSWFSAEQTLNFKEAAVFGPPQICRPEKKYKNKPYRTYAGSRYLGGYSDHFPVIVELNKKTKENK